MTPPRDPKTGKYISQRRHRARRFIDLITLGAIVGAVILWLTP